MPAPTTFALASAICWSPSTDLNGGGAAVHDACYLDAGAKPLEALEKFEPNFWRVTFRERVAEAADRRQRSRKPAISPATASGASSAA